MITCVVHISVSPRFLSLVHPGSCCMKSTRIQVANSCLPVSLCCQMGDSEDLHTSRSSRILFQRKQRTWPRRPRRASPRRRQPPHLSTVWAGLIVSCQFNLPDHTPGDASDGLLWRPPWCRFGAPIPVQRPQPAKEWSRHSYFSIIDAAQAEMQEMHRLCVLRT